MQQFESEKQILQQRINVIEELQKERTGGQELLTAVAGTVVRTDGVWLTSLSKAGNTLTFEGEAGSVNAVANFITQMKRSGYFDKIEIKEAKENDLEKSVQTFAFTMSAEIASAQTAPASRHAARWGSARPHRRAGAKPMATPFRDWPWPIQALIYLGVAFLIVLLGLWTPFSPVAKVGADLEAAKGS